MEDLLPGTLKHKIKDLPVFYGQVESEVIRIVYTSFENIPIIDSGLRAAFWEEYDKAIVTRRKMKSENIYKGVCSKRYWVDFVQNPKKLAYMLTEPARTKYVIEYMHRLGVQRIMEILKITPTKKDISLMKTQADLFKFLDQKIYGKPVETHNINQKTQSMNYNVNKELPKAASDMTADELEKHLAILREQEKSPPQIEPPPIEAVTTMVMDEVESTPTINDVMELQRHSKNES